MKKILIVDDEAGIVEESSEFLQEEGYDVETADTGQDGIKKLLEFRPELVILDMKLPDMSGIDVLRVIRKEVPQTKVIVNTGYVDQKLIDEAEALGRDVFLQKPFDLERLIREVENCIGSSK